MGLYPFILNIQIGWVKDLSKIQIISEFMDMNKNCHTPSNINHSIDWVRGCNKILAGVVWYAKVCQ